MKRRWRIKDVHERSAHIFTGSYKGHHLNINREIAKKEKENAGQ